MGLNMVMFRILYCSNFPAKGFRSKRLISAYVYDLKQRWT